MGLKARLGLVVLSGGLLALCFAPIGWWPLVVVALPPLFLAMRGATAREAFYLGLGHGFVLYGATLSWLFGIFGAATVALLYILGFFTGIFCLLLRALNRRRWSPYATVLMIAALWTGVEFYRSEVFFLRFPWMSTGSSMGPTYLLPVVGVYGTTFLIVLAAAGLLYRKTWRMGMALSLALLAFGAFRPGRVEPAAEKSLTVTVVQSEEGFLETNAELARSTAGQQPDLVVWPEYSIRYDVRQRPSDMEKLKALCAELDATLVLGTKTIVGKGDRDWRSTALTMDADGVVGEYYKARPVPFFNDGIPGTEFDPIQTRLGPIGTAVCFDCDNTTVARDITARGAEFFAVPIFDAESWGPVQHVQHAALISLRAVENGRWFACAASSGVSQIIDPHGQIHAALPLMKPGATAARIERRTGLTVYTRFGWLLPWIALGITVGFTLLAIGMAFLEKRRAKQG